MQREPTTTPQEQKTSSRLTRWVVFLLVFTPVYAAIVWLLMEFGIGFLNLDDSHNSLVLLLLVGIYIAIGISNQRTSFPLYKIKSDHKKNKGFLNNYFSSNQQGNSFFTDEIDMLEASMQTMLKNLKEQKTELIESREKMQELARITLRSQENERRHISRELHDQAGQLLVSLRYTVQTLLSDLQPDSPSQTEASLNEAALKIRLSSMLTQIDKTLETVRALSHKMRPNLLDVGDINLAMQEYCTEFQEGKKITISYIGTPIPFLTEEPAISLFRFLQEALTNVLKHADASHVQVRLTCENGWVQMSVEDNGRGEAAGSSQKGIGILGMKERFLLLNGTVDASPTKSGFIITAKIPLAEAVNFPEPIA